MTSPLPLPSTTLMKHYEPRLDQHFLIEYRVNLQQHFEIVRIAKSGTLARLLSDGALPQGGRVYVCTGLHIGKWLIMASARTRAKTSFTDAKGEMIYVKNQCHVIIF